jgi:hypothetical protein
MLGESTATAGRQMAQLTRTNIHRDNKRFITPPKTFFYFPKKRLHYGASCCSQKYHTHRSSAFFFAGALSHNSQSGFALRDFFIIAFAIATSPGKNVARSLLSDKSLSRLRGSIDEDSPRRTAFLFPEQTAYRDGPPSCNS